MLDDRLQTCLRDLAQLHPRLCPRQVLGVRMGLAASDLMELELPRDDKRLLAIVETDGCFADGVSVASGCWLGRRTLRHIDFGKVAVTFVDTLSARAVRVWPNPLVRSRAWSYAPEADSRWQAQLLGYQRMPSHVLLCSDAVELIAPPTRLDGREQCVECGEEIVNRREIRTLSGLMCRACAGAAYYHCAGQRVCAT